MGDSLGEFCGRVRLFLCDERQVVAGLVFWLESVCLPACESVRLRESESVHPNAGQYALPRWRSGEYGVKVTEPSES